jgi:FkbM family methyltransferase
MIKKQIFRIVTLIFNNYYGQNLLEFIAKGNLALLGIGNGAGVQKSGEYGAIKSISKYWKGGKYIVFDVGANIGQFRNMASNVLKGRFTEDEFTIYSFEPSKSTYKLLKSNFNNLSAPYLNNCGLGNTLKKSILYYDKIGSGLASQSKRDLSFINIEMGIQEEIEIITLDSFCEEFKIAKIDLLKIDVEGYEMEVLQGASNMISSGLIMSIMFEFGGSNIDTRTFFKDFYNYFEDKGYQIHRITPAGYLFPLWSYKEMYEQFRTTNFLANLKDNKSL